MKSLRRRPAPRGKQTTAAISSPRSARQTGIRIRVISGTEEARLIHLAACYGVDVGGSTAVAIDIGGGSVEVTIGTATKIVAGKSFKLGVIRLTEKFVKSDPLVGAR